MIDDRNALNSVRIGLEIIYALQRLYPGKMEVAINQRLIGSKAVINALASGQDPAAVEQQYDTGLQNFCISEPNIFFMTIK